MLASNKKAYFDYQILDTFEAGISLLGDEVKSIKNGQINLLDSFVRQDGTELFLWNANISKYKFSNRKDYDPYRARKLLLLRKEIATLLSKVKQGNLTIVPLKVFLKRGMIKLEIGLAKGKKYHEKRERDKERTLERELHIDKRKFVG